MIRADPALFQNKELETNVNFDDGEFPYKSDHKNNLLRLWIFLCQSKNNRHVFFFIPASDGPLAQETRSNIRILGEIYI